MIEQNELITAALAGNIGQINRLLNHGADINAPGRNGNALHAAIHADRFWAVATLVKRGADLEATFQGLTPLALAVDATIDRANQCNISHLPTDVINLLLEAGANPAPGLKITKDYKCAQLIQLFESALARSAPIP